MHAYIHTYFHHFANYFRCRSHIGRKRGIQITNLGGYCLVHGKIMHELMHVLGFVHEQCRNDRDKYVNIIWKNIKPGTYYIIRYIIHGHLFSTILMLLTTVLIYNREETYL